MKIDVLAPGFPNELKEMNPPRGSRLQDGVPAALPGGRAQGDAALLAVQPRGAPQVLRAAAGPRRRQEEVSEACGAEVFATTVVARRTSNLQYLPPPPRG